MPFRALRLLQTADAGGPLSFSSALQQAAGRAWSRRVLAHAPPRRNVGSHTHCQTLSNNSADSCQTASYRSKYVHVDICAEAN